MIRLQDFASRPATCTQLDATNGFELVMPDGARGPPGPGAKEELLTAFVDAFESGVGPLADMLAAIADFELGDLEFHSISGGSAPAPTVFRLAKNAAALICHDDPDVASAAMRSYAALHARHIPRRNQLVYELTYNKDREIVADVLAELELRFGALDSDARDAELGQHTTCVDTQQLVQKFLAVSAGRLTHEPSSLDDTPNNVNFRIKVGILKAYVPLSVQPYLGPVCHGQFTGDCSAGRWRAGDGANSGGAFHDGDCGGTCG